MLDIVVHSTVAIPSNDVLYAATRTNTFYYYIESVFACATFDFRMLGRVSAHSKLDKFLFGYVRKESTVTGTHTGIYDLVALMCDSSVDI